MEKQFCILVLYEQTSTIKFVILYEQIFNSPHTWLFGTQTHIALNFTQAGLLETLTEEVLQPNVDIQNLTQAAAEGLFIAACQQLDGYGQEKFLAKDDTGAEVQLGITVSGIAVVAGSSKNSRFYP